MTHTEALEEIGRRINNQRLSVTTRFKQFVDDQEKQGKRERIAERSAIRRPAPSKWR